MLNFLERSFYKFSNIFESSAVEKGQFIFFTSGLLSSIIAAVLLCIERDILFAQHDLDTQGNLQLMILSVAYTLLAIGFYWLGNHLKKRSPNSVAYAHLSIQNYCIFNTIILYYIGLFSVGAGITVAGGPIVGMILFPRRVVFYGLGVGFILACFAIGLSTTGYIPYAPLLIDPGSAHTNLAWMTIAGLYVVPHLILIVSVSIVSILEWRERERRIQLLSCMDALTNVSNRRHLMDLFATEMTEAIRKKQSISFMMVDLDHFKTINDTHGHRNGDLALQRTAQSLRDSIRQVDHIGRYGGEEFGIVLPGTPADDAIQIAERCRANLENNPVCDEHGRRIVITTSIGISSLTFSSDLPTRKLVKHMDTLLKEADKALYVAKKSGRNRVIHAHSLPSSPGLKEYSESTVPDMSL